MSWDHIPALPVQIFERETNREKNLEKAMKEAKIKARKEAAKGGDAALDAELPPAELEKVGFNSRASTEWQFVWLVPLKNFPHASIAGCSRRQQCCP